MGDFSIQHDHNGDVAVVTVSGRIDSVTAATLDTDLSKIVHDHKKVVLDLKGVEYMSSAGVRAIVKTLRSAEKSGGGIKLAGITNLVADVLETVGMMELMDTYPSVDEAVASF